jgi:hypothetical protein
MNEETKRMTPIQAIRAKCLDCMCGQTNEVKACPSSGCSLYPFRLGKNPHRTGREMTPEQRELARKVLAEAREKRGQNSVQNA